MTVQWIKYTGLLLVLFGLATSGKGQIQLDSTVLTTEVIAKNLHVPWEIMWGPDDYIWMTERNGRVSRVNPENGQITLLKKIPQVHEVGESGLLGMDLHPNFTDTPYIYLAYNYESGSNIFGRLVRFEYTPDTLENEVVLLDSVDGNTFHDGARVRITGDRKILMTTGDAGNTGYAQQPRHLNGKFLRLNLDGSVPADNPLAGSLVWSWGHRNAQGMVKGMNGNWYSSEHGPSTDDEINIIEKGRNYGWPDVMGYCDQPGEQSFCADSNVKEPIRAWTPTIAPCGLDYYDHPAIPEWRQALLLTNLKEDDLRVLQLDQDGDSIVSGSIFFDNRYGRLRDICVAPDGRIFIATSNRDGRANDGFPVSDDDRIIQIANLAYQSIQTPGNQGYVIYPNPFYKVFLLKLSNSLYNTHSNLRLVLYSINGQRVKDIPVRQKVEIIDAGRLSGNIYLYQLKTGQKVLASGKLLTD